MPRFETKEDDDYYYDSDIEKSYTDRETDDAETGTNEMEKIHFFIKNLAQGLVPKFLIRRPQIIKL